MHNTTLSLLSSVKDERFAQALQLEEVQALFTAQKSLLRRSLNRSLHLLARVLPGAKTLRPLLHSLRGVKIKGKIFIGDVVYLENEYPECVEIDDDVRITLRSTIMAHMRGAG